MEVIKNVHDKELLTEIEDKYKNIFTITYSKEKDSTFQIGINVGWNEPKKFYKPYVCIELYILTIQFGFIWNKK